MLLFSDNLTIEYIISFIIVILISMTIHEFSHCYAAHLMGDPTPSRLGHLTLNPFVHIYWPGFITAIIVGFGILGLAPINPRLMRNPRLGSIVATAAGPVSNFIVAIIVGIVIRIIGINEFFDLPPFFFWFLWLMLVVNLIGFVFSLVPLAPLDGWHIMLALLPTDLAYWWQRNAQNSQFVLMGIILLGFVLPNNSPLNPMTLLVHEPIRLLTDLLAGF